MSSFESMLDDERKTRVAQKAFLLEVLKLDGIRGLHDSETEKALDIDWVGTKTFTLEVKFNNMKYVPRILNEEYILIETVSAEERNTPGWIFTCKADILAITFPQSDGSLVGWTFKRQKLKDWWKFYGSKNTYRECHGTTRKGKFIYHTLSLAVPLKDIPDECLISGRFGTYVDDYYFEEIKS